MVVRAINESNRGLNAWSMHGRESVVVVAQTASVNVLPGLVNVSYCRLYCSTFQQQYLMSIEAERYDKSS